MSLFPAADQFENAFDAARTKNWDRLLAVREEVLKALEPLRAAKTISASLEARVTLTARGDLQSLLMQYAAELPALFIVSQVEIADAPVSGARSASNLQGLEIKAERALGAKCNRCWNYSVHVGESGRYPTVCERCLAALEEIERDGGLAEESAAS